MVHKPRSNQKHKNDPNLGNLLAKVLPHVDLWVYPDSASSSELADIYPLKGGLSSSSIYRLNFRNRMFVLRFSPHNADLQTRQHQVSLAQVAGRIGVGPNVHYVAPNAEAIIMDYFPGRLACPHDFEN